MATRTSPTAAQRLSHIRRPRLELDATAPLRLDSDGGGWLIEEGAVDLFVVALVDGRPHGARLPLCSFVAGELLLTLPAATGHTVIAVARLGTVINPLRAEDIGSWSPTSFALLCDTWIGAIAAAACGDRPAARDNASDNSAEIGDRASL